MKTLGRLLWRVPSRGAARVRARLLHRPQRPEPMTASVLDDLADSRPWNLVLKALRAWARLTRRPLEDGVTVVIVTWNTLPVTQTTVRLVQKFSPRVRLLVVDNGSSDGTRQWLRSERSLRRLVLPVNAGHAVALDIACLLVRTSVAVCLDSDAFPIRSRWLEPLTDALADPRVVVAGCRSSRGFVHPVFLAIRTAEFRRRGLSFQPHVLPGVPKGAVSWGQTGFDTGELLSRRLDESEKAFIPAGPCPVPGLPGILVGDAVYHHGGISRAAGGGLEPESLTSWHRAVASLAGPEPLRAPPAHPPR